MLRLASLKSPAAAHERAWAVLIVEVDFIWVVFDGARDDPALAIWYISFQFPY